MKRPSLRFTIRSMMIGMIIVGIFSWIISGLLQHGISWITQPPLYMVLVYPFLFAGALTILVTVVQSRRERRPQCDDRTTDPDATE